MIAGLCPESFDSTRRKRRGDCWDAWPTQLDLARISAQRARFRIRRTLNRIRSPRRIVATALSVVFFCVYILAGIFILSARQPADPERLRLWLSGGMVIYAVYHLVRCVWSNNVDDLALTEAERLWLGGAPIQRSSLAVYHVGSMVVPAALKTLLLAVVLARDVSHFELLLLGLFTSLVLLETVRLIIARWAAALAPAQLSRVRFLATLVAFVLVFQVIANVMACTPANSATSVYVLNVFRSLGQTTACETIQWASLPWVAAAHLTVAQDYSLLTLGQLLATICVLPLSIMVLVRVDTWSSRKQHQREQRRLAQGDLLTSEGLAANLERNTSLIQSEVDRWLPDRVAAAAALVARQWVSVRRYRATIVFSFLVPTLLCLSPLLTGQVIEQWFYVVGGIALCTTMLAPPALRIDFRRDLRRMLLLRSLPVKPLSMVMGQLTLPVLITWIFQWVTILVAALVIQPSLSQVTLWLGILAALAVFTFALENALFLAYPHHERSEGVAMMIRAKLTFLGKGTMIAGSLAVLVAWAMLCRSILPDTIANVSIVTGAIAATWSIAAAAVAAATWCWSRFDLGYDTPPE